MISLFSVAFSWNTRLGHQCLFGCAIEHARHPDHHRSCPTAKESGDESAICLESKTSDHHASDFAFRTLPNRLATVYDLCCHHTVHTDSFLIRTEFSLSQLLSIRFQSTLSNSVSAEFTGDQRETTNPWKSPTTSAVNNTSSSWKPMNSFFLFRLELQLSRWE